MDDREFGFYMRCLNHSWLNRGLPADLQEVARIIGRPEAYVTRVWPRVGKCFEEHEGRLVNPKQEEQRAVLDGKRKNNRNAAVTGWEKRRQCKLNANASQTQCERNASEMKMQCYPEPQPEPEPETTTTAPQVAAQLTAAEWPESTSAVCSEFTTTDSRLMFQIIHAATQSAADEGLNLTDNILAQAIREARSKTKSQYNAVLYERTVPSVIRNWAREAKRKRV